jgi:hypothetical protein
MDRHDEKHVIDLVVKTSKIVLDGEHYYRIKTAPGMVWDLPKKYCSNVMKTSRPFYMTVQKNGMNVPIERTFLRAYHYYKNNDRIPARNRLSRINDEKFVAPGSSHILIKVYKISKYTDEYEIHHLARDKKKPVCVIRLPHINKVSGLPAFYAGAGNVYYVARAWRTISGHIEDFFDFVPRNLWNKYNEKFKEVPKNKRYKHHSIKYIAMGTDYDITRWFMKQRTTKKDDETSTDRRAIPITGDDPLYAIKVRGHKVGSKKHYIAMADIKEPDFALIIPLDDPIEDAKKVRTCALTPSNGKGEENVAEPGKVFSKEINASERYDLYATDDKRLQIMNSMLGDSTRGQWDTPIWMPKDYREEAGNIPGNNVFCIFNWDPQNAKYKSMIGNDTAIISETAKFRIIADRTKVMRVLWHPEVSAFFITPKGEMIDVSMFGMVDWKQYLGLGQSVENGQVMFVVGCTPLEYALMKDDRKKVMVHRIDIPGHVEATVDAIDIDQIDRNGVMYRIIALKYSWSVNVRVGTKFSAHGRKWSISGIVPDRFMYVLDQNSKKKHVDMIFRPLFKGNTGLAFIAEAAKNEQLVRGGVDPRAVWTPETDISTIAKVDTMDEKEIKDLVDYAQQNMIYSGHLQVEIDNKEVNFSTVGVLAGYIRVMRVSDEDLVSKVSTDFENHLGVLSNALHLNTTALFTIFAHIGLDNRNDVFSWIKQLRDPQWNFYMKDMWRTMSMVQPVLYKGKPSVIDEGWKVERNTRWLSKDQCKNIAKKMDQDAVFLTWNNLKTFDNKLDIDLLRKGGLVDTIIDEKFEEVALFVQLPNGKYTYIPVLAKDAIGLNSGEIIANQLAKAFNGFYVNLKNHIKSSYGDEIADEKLLKAYNKLRSEIKTMTHRIARHLYRNPVKGGLMSRLTGWGGLALNEIGIGRGKLIGMCMGSQVVRDMYSINLDMLRSDDREIINAELSKIDYVLAVKYPVHRYDARFMKVKIMRSNRISINPRTASVFNGDFDGDLIQVFPLTKKLRSKRNIKVMGVAKNNPHLLPLEDTPVLIPIPDMYTQLTYQIRDMALAASEKMYQKISVGFFASFGIRIAYLVLDAWLNGSTTDEELLEYLGGFYRSSYEDFIQKDTKQNWDAVKSFYTHSLEVSKYNKSAIIKVFKNLNIKGVEILGKFLPNNIGKKTFYGWVNAVNKFSGITGVTSPAYWLYHKRLGSFLALGDETDNFWFRLLSHK